MNNIYYIIESFVANFIPADYPNTIHYISVGLGLMALFGIVGFIRGLIRRIAL